MRRIQWKSLCGTMLFVLSGCIPYNAAHQYTSQAVQSPRQSTQGEPLATSTQIRSSAPYSSPSSASLPLSEPGPFFVGKHTYVVKDESRNGREISLAVYYPAVMHTDADGNPIVVDAEADRGDAPYPLILTGTNTGSYLFKSHLASYGFVMAIVVLPDAYDAWDFQVVDHPRDFLFALDQIADDPPDGLEGIIDTDNVGVGGYSGDGFISLALSGVRIDPEFYLSHCETAKEKYPDFSEWYIEFSCNLAKKWDAFLVHVGDYIQVGEDGLWEPISDERIRAVMPMAADTGWLYGDRGLSMADRPAFMVAPTNDEYSPYHIETAFIFENYGAAEKYMVSFVGKKHMMVMQTETARQLNHFAVAFFGYYLQGKSDYAQYFSPEFVSQFKGLAWGMYEGD
jgi:predicted dienelactone hydrolase